MKIISRNAFVKEETKEATSVIIECSANSAIQVTSKTLADNTKIYIVTVEE